MSAYACEPGRGSESEVGWRWALAAASLGHEVTVLTRSNNAAKIEAASKEWHDLPIRFEYRETALPLLWVKRHLRMPRLYYLAWQLSTVGFIIKSLRAGYFDLYHHLTYVSARFPSPMALAGRRFVWGPVGGLGRIPASLRPALDVKGRLLEALRDLLARLDRVNPFWWGTVLSAKRVLVADEDTLSAMPDFVRRKALLCPAVGIDATAGSLHQSAADCKLVVLVGELTARKGQALALQALERLKHLDWSVMVIGEGEGQHNLRRLVCSLDLEARVRFLGPLPREQVREILAARPIFVSLSLRDSGGMALLEAAAAGCPLVFLGVGGPKQLMGSLSSGVVPVGRASEVVEAAATALERLMTDCAFATRLGEEARAVVQRHVWDNKQDALRWLYGDFSE